MTTFPTRYAKEISGVTRESLQSLQAHDLDLSIGIPSKHPGRVYTEEGVAKLLLINDAMRCYALSAKVAGTHLLHAHGVHKVTTPSGVTITYDIPKAIEIVRQRAAALGLYAEAAE